MPISLPSLKEQEEIVAKIRTALDSIEAVAKTKNEAMKLLSKLREAKLSGQR
jgi:restriction endonuclease S subunit